MPPLGFKVGSNGFDFEGLVARDAIRSSRRLRHLLVLSSSLFSKDCRWRLDSSSSLDIFESMLAPMSLVESGSSSV